jgi:hypothetical protein
MSKKPKHKEVVYSLKNDMINNGYIKMMIGDNYHFIEKGITAMDYLFTKAHKSDNIVTFNKEGENTVIRAAGDLIEAYALRAETDVEDKFIDNFVLLGDNAAQFFKDESVDEKERFQNKLRTLKIVKNSRRTMSDMAQSMKMLIGISKRVNTFRPSMFQVNNDYVKNLLGEVSEDEVQ